MAKEKSNNKSNKEEKVMNVKNRDSNAVKLYMTAQKDSETIRKFNSDDRQNFMLYLSLKFKLALSDKKAKDLKKEEAGIFENLKFYDQYIDQKAFDKVVTIMDGDTKKKEKEEAANDLHKSMKAMKKQKKRFDKSVERHNTYMKKPSIFDPVKRVADKIMAATFNGIVDIIS